MFNKDYDNQDTTSRVCTRIRSKPTEPITFVIRDTCAPGNYDQSLTGFGKILGTYGKVEKWPDL